MVNEVPPSPGARAVSVGAGHFTGLPARREKVLQKPERTVWLNFYLGGAEPFRQAALAQVKIGAVQHTPITFNFFRAWIIIPAT